jgi:hypothetical protein
MYSSLRFPGIYSARWGGKKSNFNLAIKRVYKELKKNDVNWYKIKQTARFVCTLTVYWPNNKFINVCNINRYLFNILDHTMVPPHIPIEEEEKKILAKKYNIIQKKEPIFQVYLF